MSRTRNRRAQAHKETARAQSSHTGSMGLRGLAYEAPLLLTLAQLQILAGISMETPSTLANMTSPINRETGRNRCSRSAARGQP